MKKHLLALSFLVLYSNLLSQQFTKITTGIIVSDGGESRGCGWADYDNDGDLDILVTNREQNNVLYSNNGNGTFTKITQSIIFTDGGNSRGISWGDYNNDGNIDIFIGNQYQRNYLYHNNGNGIFTKATSGSIVNDEGIAYNVSWGDYDNDGDLDLFVANCCGQNNLLYSNNGNSTFTKITSGAIVNDGGNSISGNWIDYDNDGDLDLFVTNGDANAPNQKNFLYTNNGDRTFTKVTEGALVNDQANSWSSSWGDYDNDGDLDLFVATIDNQNDLLYRNNGDGTFAKVVSGDIVNDRGICYGSSWGDYDNDGDLDLFVTRKADKGNLLYANNGDGTFAKVMEGVVVNEGDNSGGCAWGDYDNDGDLDLFVANTVNQNNFLYSNNGNTNSWINIKCIGTVSNTSAIGAKIRVKAQIRGKSYWQMQEISGQTGHLSQNSLNAEFGLGDATQIDSIKIEWPSRIVQILVNVSVNQLLTVIESRSKPLVPRNLRVTAGDRQITLNWDANTEPDLLRYRIYGGTTLNPTTKVDSVDGVANTTKTLTGLSNGTKYYFRITAVDQNLNQSGFSNEVSATPTLIDLPPAPPKNLTATAGDKQITLKWDANSELDLLRYRIYGGIAPNPTTAIDSVLAALGTTKIIAGLNNGTKYYFRLTAVDLTLNVSGFSNEVSATPTTGPAAPNAPTNLAATPVSSTQINLTWSDNSINETSFEIERKTGAGGAYAVIATRPGDASTGADNYSNTGLSPNTSYFYRVRAVLNTVTPILYSNYSNEISATTFPAIPAAPSNLAASAISNSQIRLSWNAAGVTGEEGFRIYRSTAAGVAIIAGNLVGSVGINIETFTDTGLSATNTYYYKVVAFNISGNSAPSNEASATPAGDKTPPILSAVSYAPKVNLNTETPVSLSITDLSGIKNATLYYRSGGAASFSSRAMALQTGSTYTQTIPAAAVTNRGVEFYVTTEDNFNNLSQSPLHPIQVYCPNGVANPNTQPSGKDAGAYRIFSVPLDLDNKSPAAFLNANSTLGAYDNTKYRWYGLERSTPTGGGQRLQEYPNFGSMTMTPDMGFALLVSLQNLKLKTGSGTTVVTTKPYNIALPAGWSLIGNPFNYNIPFDSLRVSAGTFELWRFEGDWQINTAGLEPWKGYAIWLSQAATFSIRAGLAGLKSAASFYSVEHNDAKNWLVQIIAENGRSAQTGSASRFNFVGQNELATDDEDQFDLHQPLRLTDGVELVFNEQLTTDIRQSSANGHTWELTCMLNPADEMLSLAFEGIHSIPSSFEVFLIDRETPTGAAQTAYDLRRNQRLQFATRNRTEKRFQLVAGTKAYLNSQALEAELHPANYVLLQNFPNPFNPATQIIYSLPEANHVEVSVYNLRGERVASLVNEPQASGSHSVVWNATEVGSGVYLIRIRAGRFESMKKCLFVK